MLRRTDAPQQIGKVHLDVGMVRHQQQHFSVGQDRIGDRAGFLQRVAIFHPDEWDVAALSENGRELLGRDTPLACARRPSRLPEQTPAPQAFER